jgi:hypothetical protein
MANIFQVFLSGVMNDRTKPFRALIQRSVEGTGWARVWVFEKEPAHHDLEGSYLAQIDLSDLFVVCLWDDITDVVKGEYERARQTGLPRLVFLAGADPPNEKLRSFLDGIRQEIKWQTCAEEELPSAVAKAIVSHLIDVHRRTFIRQTYVATPVPKTVIPDHTEVQTADAPISEEAAALLAVRVIPGRIVRAVPFVEELDGRSRLAVLTETGQFARGNNAFLLQEFAGAYRIEWESNELHSIGAWRVQPDWFGAEDVDGDRRREIFFAEGSHGTGSGADVFYLYAPNSQRLFSMTVEETRDPYYRTWLVPCRELKAPQNAIYLEALESRMEKFRIMAEVRITDEAPDVLWYMDNGFLKFGKAKLRRFPGPPAFGASPLARHKDGSIEWYAYFKGPVIGHDVSSDEHFVIYGPETMYRWPTCFASNGEFLWFGTRGDGVFQYDKQQGFLKQMPPGLLRECPPDVSALELRGAKLVVNGSCEFGVPWR